jgi:hypothetical protein
VPQDEPLVTSEKFILPVNHGDDRCAWFVVLTGEIVWDVKEKATGNNRARTPAAD